MGEQVSGGCQCGQVRFTVAIDDDGAYLCHCRMCQRASGGVSMAFKNVRRDALEWHGAPTWYRSSPIAHRPFCVACGTPLGFAYLENTDNIDLTVGSFDEPYRFKPMHHFAAESMHEAWLDTRELPRQRSDENANLAERWKEAGAQPPAP